MEPAEYTLMDAAEGRMWWYRALHRRLLDALAPVRGCILDAGCGMGGFLALVKDQRPDLTRFGLEWDPTAALRARSKSEALVARGSVNTLPFAAGAFDAVVSADVLCHAAVDPWATLNELRRVLKPGGRMVLNLPSYRWLMSAHDRHVHNVRRFTARGAAGLLRDVGFARIRTGYWNSLLLPLMIAQRKLLAPRNPVSDVAPFSPWLDATFHAATKIERRLPVPLPFGGSVLAIAERP